jgi:hypothetical protein
LGGLLFQPMLRPLISTVMGGLDARIPLVAKQMACRLEPGNDDRCNMNGNRPGTMQQCCAPQ